MIVYLCLRNSIFFVCVSVCVCPCPLQRTYVLKESTLGASAQYLFEGLPEVFVEDGVYDRVE